METKNRKITKIGPLSNPDPIPNPQSPIPNPQTPNPNTQSYPLYFFYVLQKV